MAILKTSTEIHPVFYLSCSSQSPSRILQRVLSWRLSRCELLCRVAYSCIKIWEDSSEKEELFPYSDLWNQLLNTNAMPLTPFWNSWNAALTGMSIQGNLVNGSLDMVQSSYWSNFLPVQCCIVHVFRLKVQSTHWSIGWFLLDKTTEPLSGLPCKQVLHRPERAGITAFLLPIVQYIVYTVWITLNIAFLGASVRFTQRKFFLFDDCWSTRPDLVCHFRRDTTV